MKWLFTPGPLNTSAAVKAAMGRDVGSRDREFLEVVQAVRHRLLGLAQLPDDRLYSAVLLPGSGTYALEAAIGSTIPPRGKFLVVANGAYGERLARIARALNINHTVLAFPENLPPDPAVVEAALGVDPEITALGMVHVETSSGMVNPVTAIGALARRWGKHFLVDSMSGFGVLPLNPVTDSITWLISSANKCLESVPGMAFVIAERLALSAAAGLARSLSLDLCAQWRELEENGQFRFTPPTQVILALHEALREHEREGGIPGRAARYRANHQTLAAGMEALGFVPFLPQRFQGFIITAYYDLEDRAFAFPAFYEGLSRRGFIIYPGKISRASCFRIGTIGQITPHEITLLLEAARATLNELGVRQR